MTTRPFREVRKSRLRLNLAFEEPKDFIRDKNERDDKDMKDKQDKDHNDKYDRDKQEEDRSQSRFSDVSTNLALHQRVASLEPLSRSWST